MVESIVEFFRNLPAKACDVCGEKIEEQHECYSNKCNECNIV
ncbi:YhfH family protein [Sporosarcina luteola]|nr:protein YhfH [Sporosarcina luteola]MCM3743910.1 YhfH family protein [Sporosarcina luteola]